jgi:hypothetical protein
MPTRRGLGEATSSCTRRNPRSLAGQGSLHANERPLPQGARLQSRSTIKSPRVVEVLGVHAARAPSPNSWVQPPGKAGGPTVAVPAGAAPWPWTHRTLASRPGTPVRRNLCTPEEGCGEDGGATERGGKGGRGQQGEEREGLIYTFQSRTHNTPPPPQPPPGNHPPPPPCQTSPLPPSGSCTSSSGWGQGTGSSRGPAPAVPSAATAALHSCPAVALPFASPSSHPGCAAGAARSRPAQTAETSAWGNRQQPRRGRQRTVGKRWCARGWRP